MLIANALLEQLSKSHFNTSHVNVNLQRPCLRQQVSMISIHLMLMLIFFWQLSFFSICEISIHLMLMLIELTLLLALPEPHFNTSHVNVNLLIFVFLRLLIIDFNTSHVNVNHVRTDTILFSMPISIHLMLMLIWQESILKKGVQEFQYISC